MEQKDFLELAAKVAGGKASDEELKLYASIYERFQGDKLSSWDAAKYGDENRLAALLDSRLRPARRRRAWIPVSAAATILLSIIIGSYFFLNRSAKQSSQQLASKDDVAPGHSRATLVLTNGKKITLTRSLNGEIATEGQTRIDALDGQLVYQSASGNQETGFNTLTTARGEQSPYPVVLADGTRVWLNAQSSLTFPVNFSGAERVVKLSGEAYFEVTHRAAHPFKVQTAGGIVEDIGTQFNIHAYPDEKHESATLLEGAVKITTKESSRLLKPGEQAKYRQGNIEVRDVDTEESVAWKNGYFMFNDVALASVMQELGRWYDVDVRFEEESLKQLTFVASITRYTNISKVLQVMEMTRQVRFKIEGRVITVYPGNVR